MADRTLLTEISTFASELRVTSANEATTRLKLIDTIIFHLLGWKKVDVKIEERVSEDGTTTFYDYVLSAGHKSILIEAKKISASFLPLPVVRKKVMKGNWVRKGTTGDAIIQARTYARTLGVGFCVATNGLSWVVFPVNRRDQVAFEDSVGIIFPDIVQTLEENQEEFLALLSRRSVINGSLDRELLGTDRDQNEPRRLNDIYDKSFSKVNRASIFHSIEREIITAFNEDLLSENVQVLEKCYVQTPERTRFDSRIQMYLTPRDQVLKSRPIRPVSRRGDSQAVKNLVNETRLSSKPIALLTVGLVGAGKTTFLNYVAKVSSADHFKISDAKPSGHWVYADFRNYSKVESPQHYLVDRIFEYIKQHPFLGDYDQCVGPAYAGEIENLKRGPLKLLVEDDGAFRRAAAEIIINDYNEKTPYIRRIMSFATGVAPVFLVVDNVDQQEDVGLQSEIFLEATALARALNCNLVLAMRDSTYVKNRGSAVFDAFDFDAVYIDPPDILSVLSKRFTVAAQLLQGKRIEFQNEAGQSVVAKNGKIVVDLLSQSVMGTEVGHIIEVAATGDTRLALQMTRQFLQFGYSATSKALRIYELTGRYRLPPHEALRAIMLGNQNVYREDFSVFGNPLDARLGRSDLQFLRIYLMHVFVSYSSEREFEGLLVRDVIRELEKLGIGERETEQVLSDLVRFRYLFSRSHQEYSKDSLLIPSRFCGFVVRDLIGRMMFIENIMFDTFVFDETVWDNLKSNAALIFKQKDPLKKFRARREVVRQFYDFCEVRLEKLPQLAREAGLAPQWCSNPLARMKTDFTKDLQHAGRSAKNTFRDLEKPNLPLFKSGARSVSNLDS